MKSGFTFLMVLSSRIFMMEILSGMRDSSGHFLWRIKNHGNKWKGKRKRNG